MHGVIVTQLQARYDRDEPGRFARLASECGVGWPVPETADVPDEQVLDLVHRGAAELNLSPSELLIEAGTMAIPGLAQRFPAMFEKSGDVIGFLTRLEPRIHRTMQAILRRADPPRFTLEPGPEENTWTLLYESRRRLGSLALGLARGLIEQYGESMDIEPVDPLDQERVRFLLTRR